MQEVEHRLWWLIMLWVTCSWQARSYAVQTSGTDHVHAAVEDDLPHSLPAHYAKVVIISAPLFPGDVCFSILRTRARIFTCSASSPYFGVQAVVTHQPCKDSLQALMQTTRSFDRIGILNRP